MTRIPKSAEPPPTRRVQSLRRSFTRLSRFFAQLMRAQLSCGPITAQQCYTLEALVAGPRGMRSLADEVALHQSTMTRIVGKLEKQGFVRRTRRPDNQRSVEVSLTREGAQLYERLDEEATVLAGHLLALVPADKQDSVVNALELVAGVLEPETQAFQDVLGQCCAIAFSRQRRLP